MRHHNPNVFDASEHGDDHPCDEHKVVAGMCAYYEKKGTNDAEKGIKDWVLDERTNTNILPFTFFAIGINKFCIFDNIEDGSDYSDNQLDDTNDDDCQL